MDLCPALVNLALVNFLTAVTNAWQEPLKEERVCLGSQFEGTVHRGGGGVAAGAQDSWSFVPSQEAEREVNTGSQLACWSMVSFTVRVGLSAYLTLSRHTQRRCPCTDSSSSSTDGEN